MNFYEKINATDYKSIRDQLYEEQTRIENEIFICSVGLFCEQIELFKHAYPEVKDVVLGFEYVDGENHLVVKSQSVKYKWNSIVNTCLEPNESDRVARQTSSRDIYLNLTSYDRDDFRDKLIGPDLAHYILREKMEMALEEKLAVKKIKI